MSNTAKVRGNPVKLHIIRQALPKKLQGAPPLCKIVCIAIARVK